MRVESVRLEGRDLILTLPGPSPEARKLVYKFKPGEYELTKTVKKRSLDANAYCWVLCDKIARAVGITKEEVYRDAILRVGGYIQHSFRADKFDKYCRTWEAQGIGNQVQLVGRVGDDVIVNAYYGSHLYDTAEMSRLINDLVDTARGMDIETMPEEELQSLLTSWG